jgi:hypothetical protein
VGWRVKRSVAFSPLRLDGWFRKEYPEQEVVSRIEWHVEGDMGQWFTRLNDRVVLVHLVSEGERLVLKGRLEIPLDVWKPGSVQATPKPRQGVCFRHRTSEVIFSGKVGRAPEYGKNLVEGWLADMRSARHQPRTPSQQNAALRGSLNRIAKQMETASLHQAGIEAAELTETLDRIENLLDGGHHE